MDSHLYDILARVEEGIAAGENDNLFTDLIGEVPELCRPHTSEVDGGLNRGCTTMMTIIGKTALITERGSISIDEAIASTRRHNTCEDCPFRTFD